LAKGEREDIKKEGKAPFIKHFPFPLLSETDNPIPYVPFTVRMNPMKR